MSTVIVEKSAVQTSKSSAPTGGAEVKFFYLHDPDNPGRVMTIARKFGKNGNKIHYAIAVCKPSVKIGRILLFKADEFRKDIGRTITEGRLNKDPRKIAVVEGESPIITVMRDISTSKSDAKVPKFVKGLAADWLKVRLADQEVFHEGLIS